MGGIIGSLITEDFFVLFWGASALGFALMPGVSVSLEFACELAYPIGAEAVVGFLYAVAQTFSAIIVNVFTFLFG